MLRPSTSTCLGAVAYEDIALSLSFLMDIDLRWLGVLRRYSLSGPGFATSIYRCECRRYSV